MNTKAQVMTALQWNSGYIRIHFGTKLLTCIVLELEGLFVDMDPQLTISNSSSK